MEINQAWIDEQRQISEIVDMVCEDAPGSEVPLLKQIEKSQTAALDALEASMQREAEKDATIAALRAQVDSLTRERDAAKWRADAGAIRTAVRPFEKGDKKTLTKYTQFCKRLAASHKPEMPSEDRMLLLLTDICVDRLCVSMQRLTVERDAAVSDMRLLVQYENPCALCNNKYCVEHEDDDDALCCPTDEKDNRWEWRGPCAENAQEESKDADR